jgi:hypothetical protein
VSFTRRKEEKRKGNKAKERAQIAKKDRNGKLKRKRILTPQI